MVYLLFAAVECAIQAAKQGGTAYQIMWFSILVTYGGEPNIFSLGKPR
jgi:chitin synthase